MEKIDAEATRLARREVSRGKRRAHYKSIFFLCKGPIGIPRTTKKGRWRRIEAIAWATAIMIIGFKARR